MQNKEVNQSKNKNLVLKWAKEFQSFSQKSKGLMLACSGGLDSTVLFHLLLDFLKLNKNLNLKICHINFGLRAKKVTVTKSC